jgi:hypothetical protein
MFLVEPESQCDVDPVPAPTASVPLLMFNIKTMNKHQLNPFFTFSIKHFCLHFIQNQKKKKSTLKFFLNDAAPHHCYKDNISIFIS